MEDHDHFPFLQNGTKSSNSVSNCHSNYNDNKRKNSAFEVRLPTGITQGHQQFPAFPSPLQLDWIQPNPLEQNVRLPKCAKCCNHGMLVPVKNHKRFCLWKRSQCNKCFLALYRRRVKADKTARRRAQAQDSATVRAKVDQDGMTYLAYRHHVLNQSQPKPIMEVKSENCMLTNCELPLANMPLANKLDTGEPQGGQTKNTMVTTIDEINVSMRTLLTLFHIPNEMDFLIYATLKDNLGDLIETSAKIVAAQRELRSWKLFCKAVRGVHSVKDTTTVPYT